MESLEDAMEVEKINQINKADFLSDVPANLRFKVTENIYDGVANKVLLFKGRDPDLVSNMIPKMTPMKVKKSEFVYKKGQFSSAIYLLFHGRVVEMDNDINFREYSVGSYFGEVEIFKNSPRKYSIKAIEDCQLMVIDRNDLFNSLQFYPELKIDLISSAIVKDFKTKQTLHKIKDLRSLIRVDRFWERDEIEFNKAVSEKIMGLYYFNKKKYENYIKQIQQKKGWFRKDQGLPGDNMILASPVVSQIKIADKYETNDQKSLRNLRAELRNIEGSHGAEAKRFHLNADLNYLEGSKVNPSLNKVPEEHPEEKNQTPKAETPTYGIYQRISKTSPVNIEELNKKLITDLNSKIEVVKRNFNQHQTYSKKIGDKVTEIDDLLTKLFKKKVPPKMGHAPQNYESNSLSLDLSGDLHKKNNTSGEKGDLESLFNSYSSKEELKESQRTVNKMHNAHSGSLFKGDSPLSSGGLKKPSKQISPKPMKKNSKPSTDYARDKNAKAATRNSPRSKASAKLESIKEADENQERMSSNRGVNMRKQLSSTLVREVDEVARQDTKKQHSKYSVKVGKYSPLPPIQPHHGSNRDGERIMPPSEIQDLLKEMNMQLSRHESNQSSSGKNS